MAFEGVGGKYRAVFAEPKGSSRTPNSSSSDRSGSRHEDYNMISPYGGSGSGGGGSGGGGGGGGIGSANNSNNHGNRGDYAAFLNNPIASGNKGNFSATSGGGGGGTGANENCGGEVQLNVIVSSSVNQDQLWRLFDIVPGLEYCHITGECNRNSNYATAAYSSFDKAQYAR